MDTANEEAQKSLRGFIKEIEEMEILLRDDILKGSFFEDTKERIERALDKMRSGFEQRDSLLVEKIIPKWRSKYKSGIYIKQRDFDTIQPLREIMLNLLTKYGQPLATALPKNERVIPAGKPYEGKQYLRSILNQASSSILIRDSYLRAEILDILSEYILDNQQLKIRLLTWDGSRLASFKNHYTAFEAQYPKTIEARYLPTALKDHPRYLLIDEQKLFNPDHSIDQWGISTVNIHEYTNKESITEIKDNLESEWNIALTVKL